MLSKLIVPVAAVAEMVAVSSIFVALWLAFEEVPLKVCRPVNVFATLTTGRFAPARVDAPVPPFAIGSMPVSEVACVDATFTKSVPFQAQTAFSFKTIVTPVVGPAPRSTML